MSIAIIGSRNAGSSPEWFPVFNYNLESHLRDIGVCVEDRDRYTGLKNNSSHPIYDICDTQVALNLNNVIVYNTETDKCILFTTWYDFPQLRCQSTFGALPIENITAIYTGHYEDIIIDRDWESHKHLIKPWIFRPWRIEKHYPDVRYNPINDKIFFRGAMIHLVRAFLQEFEDINDPNIDISCKKMSFDEHNKVVGDMRVCLSVAGAKDMCYRDVEYWMKGIPFIKPRFTSKMLVEIPDNTYIPVDWELDYSRYFTPVPKDGKKLVNDIIEKYNEVKDNHSLLQEIGDNGYNFYKNNFTMEKIIELTVKLLEENSIL
jgi:hypothetical protein